MHESTWHVMEGVPSVHKVDQGVLAGHAFADLVFSLIAKKALQHNRAALIAEDINFELPTTRAKELFGSLFASDALSISQNDVSYVDDFFIVNPQTDYGFYLFTHKRE